MDPPSEWGQITTIEAHTAGEPLRVIVSGIAEIPGETILEKRRYARKHLDHLRTGLMWEPRGHADMYGAIMTEPVTSDGDIGVLFLHNEGFSTMCGHGVIALGTVIAECSLIPLDGDSPVIKMDTPAGRVTATVQREGGRTTSVRFRNVPSFILCEEQEVKIPGLGRVRFDVAFGGAFYAFCRADQLDLDLTAGSYQRIIDLGRSIKNAVLESFPIRHPFQEDLGFLYGTIFHGPPSDPAHHSRNVCIFAEGELDRSPTGTGVSARAAIHFARGEIKIGESITIESILGTCFDVRVLEETNCGPHAAVIPEVSGSASIIGRHEFYFDPSDPLQGGFIFR